MEIELKISKEFEKTIRTLIADVRLAEYEYYNKIGLNDIATEVRTKDQETVIIEALVSYKMYLKEKVNK